MWVTRHWQIVFFAFAVGMLGFTLQPRVGFGQSSEPATPEAAEEAAEQEGPQTQIKISPETTVLTTPLDDRGYLNVGQAVNDYLAAKCRPEDNAAVDFLRALGGRAEGQVMTYACEQLGIEVPPETDRFVKSIRLFANQQGWSQERMLKLGQDISECPSKVWSADEFPDLHLYLEECEPGYEWIEVAIQKSGWHVPRDAKGESVIMISLSEVQEARNIARGLGSRVTLNLGEGKYDEAWRNIILMRGLARKIAQGPTLIEGLVGIAIENIACQSTLVWLKNLPETYDEFEEPLDAIRKLGPMPQLSTNLLFERLMFVDTIQMLARGGFNNSAGEALGMGQSGFDQVINPVIQFAHPDWNQVLLNANDYYDRLEAAYLADTVKECRKRLSELEEELKERAKNAQDFSQNPLRLAAWALFPNRARRESTELITNVLFSLLLPALTAVERAATRTINDQAVTTLAIKIFAERAETGVFPKSLEAMRLNERRFRWKDLVSGEPYEYRREGRGFVLYNLGQDGVDDGGPVKEGSQNGKDFGIDFPGFENQR